VATGDQVLEVYLTRDGRYAGANRVAQDLLGYTEAELREAPLGTLSGGAPDSSHELWLRFAAGELELPAGGAAELRGKDGRPVRVQFLGITWDPDGQRFVSRSVALAEAASLPTAVPVLLGEWRAAERKLEALAPGDPRRPEAEAEVLRLRAAYRAAVARSDSHKS
jgi:PAS domain-containing protein